MTERALRGEAEALAARLPALLAEAERVAATVAQGVHGRRRAGSGDSFWQFRQLMPGESISRIDWRQSARSNRAFVRETEWEAAQTVCLWHDRSPSMAWRSEARLPLKRDRAALLSLALGLLLLRGGEHIQLADDTAPVQGGRFQGSRFQGRQAAERLARALFALPRDAVEQASAPNGVADAAGLPHPAVLPRHARLVLIGDFLGPLDALEPALARLAAVPVGVQIMQVLDPAEIELPFSGRVRFEGLEGEADQLVPRVQDVREAYGAALAQHQSGLAALARRLGIGLLRHRTDQPAATALLALHEALAPARDMRAAHLSGPAPGAAEDAS